MQVRISALQQANGALMAEAAKAHACPGEPSALGKSIQSAIALLQDSPVLRERSQNSSNIRRPSSAPGAPPIPCDRLRCTARNRIALVHWSNKCCSRICLAPIPASSPPGCRTDGTPLSCLLSRSPIILSLAEYTF